MKKFIIILALILFSVPIYLFAQETLNSIDSDNDGLTNKKEKSIYHTDPQNPDTDGDGFADGIEIESGYSPRHKKPLKLVDIDSDNDYLNDKWEIALQTDLLNADSDGDKYLDGTEVAAGYDPLKPKSIKLKKYIDVDLTKQLLSYYFGNKLLDSFSISGGKSYTPTPKGKFKILEKIPVKYYGGNGYSYPNTKWNLLFARQKYRYYIHGAYWHNNFGTPVSHGCVNVHYKNMENLYWWAQIGTEVYVH